MFDYHVHSSYSDGTFLEQMVRAAADAGLNGVGFADHCIVSERSHIQAFRRNFAFNLDLTYERRRAAIDDLRSEFDIRIFDAVEMDYNPQDETAIRAFLDEAAFDYAVGSVHEIMEANVHWDYFADLPADEQRTAVDEYFESVVALVESELFDIAAHIDIVERNPALRGYATESQYRAVAEAFADSRTVPEINAGRRNSEYGEYHPNPAFLSVLAEYDVPVTVGSDSHDPEALRQRIPQLREKLATAEVETVSLAID